MIRAGGPHYYRLPPESDIGGEVYERRLSERLPGNGVELVLGLPCDHQATGLPDGVHVDVLRHREGLHWLSAPAVFVPYAIRLLRDGRVDILRGHSVRHCGPSLLTARALARASTPVVIHHHHFTHRWRSLEAAILKRADAVVTVSEHSRRQLLEAGVPEPRVHVVLDGIDRPARGPADPGSWPSPGLRLLHLGRLEPRKRPGLALDALARLERLGVEASLVLAGDGPSRARLEAHAIDTGIADRARFLGRVSDERKWQLLDSADLLLFGSTVEGFGLVVAEAQSRGVPVIAAHGTSTSEALLDGESGLLVAPRPDAFADAIVALSDDAARHAMSVRASEFATRFSWDACAAGVAHAYRSLLGG